MVPDHQVRRKRSGDASKKVQLYKVGGSRIIGTAVRDCISLSLLQLTFLSSVYIHTELIPNIELGVKFFDKPILDS